MKINLVERLINGEELAFKEVFYQYYPGLLKFAASYLHDNHLAENVVQDAFITLWEKRMLLEIQSNIKAFLVTIVKNKSINHLEKAKNRIKIEQSVNQMLLQEADLHICTLRSLNPEELFTEEIAKILEKTIQELPEQTRDIFLLSRYQGLSNQEIADKLDITVKGVEYHISKSLKLLRTKLSDYLPLFIFFIN
jgi:RNA polymerase sigma-70 factor, ECF subfamily